MTDVQGRKAWADYLEKEGIQYAFFSAANAAALQDARREALEREAEKQRSDGSNEDSPPAPSGDPEEDHTNDERKPPDSSSETSDSDQTEDVDALEDRDVEVDPRTRVLTVLELESLFEHTAPPLNREHLFTRT